MFHAIKPWKHSLMQPGDVMGTQVRLFAGNYYIDGPIYLKDGITLTGSFDSTAIRYYHARLNLYSGSNTSRTQEDAMVILDGVSNVRASIRLAVLRLDEECRSVSFP